MDGGKCARARRATHRTHRQRIRHCQHQHQASDRARLRHRSPRSRSRLQRAAIGRLSTLRRSSRLLCSLLRVTYHLSLAHFERQKIHGSAAPSGPSLLLPRGRLTDICVAVTAILSPASPHEASSLAPCLRSQSRTTERSPGQLAQGCRWYHRCLLRAHALNSRPIVRAF